jgi:hypothetical protein
MTNTKSDNALIMFFNGAAVLVAYGMLGLSLYLSTEVPLSTKCFWGIGIPLANPRAGELCEIPLSRSPLRGPYPAAWKTPATRSFCPTTSATKTNLQ